MAQVNPMAHQFDKCMRCETPTKPGSLDGFGGEGIHCPRCGWQPMEVKWAAVKVKQPSGENVSHERRSVDSLNNRVEDKVDTLVNGKYEHS